MFINKKLFNLTALVFAILISISLGSAFAGGDGSSDNPYEIENWYHLNDTRNNLSENFVLNNNLDEGTSGYNELVDTENGWKPIGNSSNHFTGTLEGNNNEIHDLYINRSDEDEVALFGATFESKINNLSLVNVNVTGKNYVGAIVGDNNAELERSNVVGADISGNDKIGGLAGINGFEIIESHVIEANVSGNSEVGGLAGNNQRRVFRSYSEQVNISGGNKIGGFVGSISGIGGVDNPILIHDSYAINGSVSGDDVVGGLLGGYDGGTGYRPINRSYSTVYVEGDTNVGGLVGSNSDDDIVENSFWDTESSGLSVSDGGTGKTTQELQDAGTFTDTVTDGLDHEWDLTTEADGSFIWNIVEGETYPYHGWESPEFSLEVVDFESNLLEGEEFWIDVEVSNSGKYMAEQDVNLSVDSAEVDVQNNLQIDGGGSEVIKLSWSTAEGDKGDYTAVVSSEDDSVSEQFTVSKPEFFEVDIIDADSFLEFGEVLEVSVNVSNAGDIQSEQTINLTDFDNELADETVVDLAGGEFNDSIELTWETAEEDVGSGEITVFSQNDSDSQTVDVLESNPAPECSSVSYESSEGYLEVKDVEELQCIGHEDTSAGLTDGYVLVDNIDVSGTQDWNNAEGFKPLGNSTHPFTGSFDGQGFEVSGLHINRTEEDYVGLFSYAENAEIRDVELSDVDISGRDNVGVLVGYSKDVTVNRVSSGSGQVSAESNIGGLTGYNDGGSIADSYSKVDIDGNEAVGGVVGVNDNTGEIRTTYSTGAVSGNTNVGGLVGINNAVVENSYWDSQSSGQSDSDGGEPLNTNEMTGVEATTYMEDLGFGDNWAVTQDYPEIGVFYDWNGEGTSDEPYMVQNVFDLQNMGLELEGNFTLNNDVDISGTEDWFNGSGFKPVGDSGNEFTGSFDGQGNEIAGLTIDRENEDYIGLFGYVESVKITDLGVVDVNVTGGGLVGVFAGTMKNANITGSYAEGYVSGSDSVGGLVGETSEVKIDASYTEVNVEGRGSADEIGGLVGGTQSSYSTTITDSYAKGDVYSDNGYEVGGLIGRARGNDIVNNSYSTGDLSGQWGIGGLLGWGTDSQLVESYATGAVDSYNTSSFGEGWSSGGLVGYMQGGNISRSYATGDVLGQSNIGGLVGGLESSPKIFDSYATGDVYAEEGSVGGFVGASFTDSQDSEDYAVVNRSYSIGFVETDAGDTGGLIGDFEEDDVVENSFWDTESSGLSVSDGGTGKTTEELQDAGTFTDTSTDGLDHEWNLTAGSNTGYVWNMMNGIYPVHSWGDGSSFEIEFSDSSIEVNEGETAEIEVEITNSGGPGMQDVVFEIDGSQEDSITEALNQGESQTLSFEWDADSEGDYTATVSTRTHSSEIEINVDTDSGDSPSGGGGGGGGGGGAPPADDESETGEEVDDVVEPVVNEDGSLTAQKDVKAGSSVSMTVPDESRDAERGSNLESISATAVGDTSVSFNVRNLDTVDVETTESQIGFSEITVDGDIEGMKIGFTVSNSVLQERNLEVGNVVKQRYSEESSEWVNLETRVVEEREDEVLLEADTEALSLYAVSIEEDTEPEDDEETENSRQDAETAINQAEELIEENGPGYETLEQARHEFEQGNYVEAETLAQQAISEHEDVQESGMAGTVLKVLVGLVVIVTLAVTAVIGYRKFRSWSLMREASKIQEEVLELVNEGVNIDEERLIRELDMIEKDIQSDNYSKAREDMDRLTEELEMLS